MNTELLQQAINRARWAHLTPQAAPIAQEPPTPPAPKPLATCISGEPLPLDPPMTVVLCVYDLADMRPRSASVDNIIQLVAAKFQVETIDILSIRRSFDFARARQVCAYLIRKYTRFSLPQIGERMGGRDHTTIMHAITRIKELRQRDPDLDAKISEIELRLKQART